MWLVVTVTDTVAPAREVAMTWLDELEARARAALPDYVYSYYAMTSGSGRTHAVGLRDWSSATFRTRVLTGGLVPSTATTVLGTAVNTPVLVAPMAQTVAAHPDGDAATATAAAQAGSLLGVSTHTAARFDRIQAAGAPWWLQVYVFRDRGVTAALVQRARDAGATALILTADLPNLSTRPAAAEPSSWPDTAGAARGTNIADLAGDRDTADDVGPDTIGWLREVSGLPVVVKGVLHSGDAVIAVNAGAAGIIVSTHGGRALDRSISSAAALPAVVEALVGTGAEVYADSGLRSGADVLAALALGARAVFVGRPVLWGLATDGPGGAQRVLERLTAELVSTMKFTGVGSVDRVPAGLVGLSRGVWS